MDFKNFETYPLFLKSKRLYGLNSKGKIRYWETFIDIVDKNGNVLNVDVDIDNCYARTWSCWGVNVNSKTKSKKTIIKIGKNIGKKNETNAFQQALLESESKIKKKITQEHFVFDKQELNKIPDLIKPMLFHDSRKFPKKTFFPCLCQPKLDGIRAMYNKDKGFYSRQGKTFSISNSLLEKCKNLAIGPECYIDGELYIHNKPLQDLSSMVRKETHKDKNLLQFFVFDIYDTGNKLMRYNDRLDILRKIIPSNDGLLKLVDTRLINNKDELDSMFNELLSNNYEGLMAKKQNAVYKPFQKSSDRTYDMLKYKPRYTSEFVCDGFTCGENGIAKGAIIWKCSTDNGIKFNVDPKNVSYSDRKKMYNEYVNNDYIGKMLTIEYDDLSKNGVPLRGKMISVRNYE